MASQPIPQPPGVPILGNIFDIDPNNTWVSLKTLADKYGEIFKIKALGHQIVFICSASLLEEVCDETRFRKCVTGPIVEIRYSVNDSLFTAYDHEPSWGIAHRIMAPGLSTSAIRGQVPIMQEVAEQLTAKWAGSEEMPEGGRQFSVVDGLRRLNIQSTVKCLFSQDISCLEGVEPPVIGAMEGATQEAVKRPTRPKLLNSLLYQRKFEAYTKTMRDFAAEIVLKRQSQHTTGDMLDALLHRKDPETGKGLTEREIIDEIVSLLIGSVTAPNFLAFALYYLLRNPRELKIAQEEIDSVFPNGERMTHEHFARLPYCEAILRESMRLSTPAPGFNIEPLPSEHNRGPIQLAGGKYEIPANQPMISVLAAVNRDPVVFADPEVFRPERMLGVAYGRIPEGVKKGFGNGKRQCIGKSYAWQWSVVTLVTILRDVDLNIADPGYQLKMDGAFSLKPVGFFAVASHRARAPRLT
ncbi:cytochrome P450 [Eremomyces bilateralis CBS 781.70]|uniref:Cytochrome P450 n=1 Tax=Eremomyces bilateralis CBS 781.70 TaxID=1392243 RepID=A0A6G1G9R1_9PEZI|nr:cytochrome P450 [Eremomyces bilateralis CBS 781.70]KAF1814732.1 cytochrome P450 [Eremomyces bilateralis CBS 781.70]